MMPSLGICETVRGCERRALGSAGVPPAVFRVPRNTPERGKTFVRSWTLAGCCAGRAARQARRPRYPRHALRLLVRLVVREGMSTNPTPNPFRPLQVAQARADTVGTSWRFQSRRDCVLQPRVVESARLPWVSAARIFNPNGVASRRALSAATPLGLLANGPLSQGSSFLATLGFEPESRWDSSSAFPRHTTSQRSRFSALFSNSKIP